MENKIEVLQSVTPIPPSEEIVNMPPEIPTGAVVEVPPEPTPEVPQGII